MRDKNIVANACCCQLLNRSHALYVPVQAKAYTQLYSSKIRENSTGITNKHKTKENKHADKQQQLEYK